MAIDAVVRLLNLAKSFVSPMNRWHKEKQQRSLDTSVWNFTHQQLIVWLFAVENDTLLSYQTGNPGPTSKFVIECKFLCGTVLNAFAKSKWMASTQSPSSNSRVQKCRISNSWVEHDRPDMNQCWCCDRLFCWRCNSIAWRIVLQIMDVRLTGR